jgi:RNA polymerase sigma-70 factor (ECF subfamily)
MAPRDTTVTAFDLTALTGSEADVSFRMDEEVFRGFYDRTSRPLWGYLYRLTGDRAKADDLLQDTYYRFLRAEVDLETDAHRRHYLFRIATNLAADGLRRQRTRPVSSGQDPDELPGRDPHTSLNQRLDVTTALSQMRVRERAMLWLAYAQGASHAEIAEVVGVKASSIKPLLFRARKRLASLLGPRNPGGAA